MAKTTLLAALIFSCLISIGFAQDKDYSKLLQKLDDKEFRIRDETRQTLIQEGFDAIVFLEKVDRTKLSLEVESAVISIIDNYYFQARVDIVSIWNLPRELRYVNEEDISLKYYELARLKLIKLNPKQNYVDQYKGYDDVEVMATYLYLLEQLKQGTDIEPLKRKMEELKFLHKITSMVYESNKTINHYHTPDAIEDIVEELKRGGFKMSFYNYYPQSYLFDEEED